jgi:hypothetical protein
MSKYIVPKSGDDRHKTCFNCGSHFNKDLNILLKRELIIIGMTCHHKYCCFNCFKLLTKYIKRYKTKDFRFI